MLIGVAILQSCHAILPTHLRMVVCADGALDARPPLHAPDCVLRHLELPSTIEVGRPLGADQSLLKGHTLYPREDGPHI